MSHSHSRTDLSGPTAGIAPEPTVGPTPEATVDVMVHRSLEDAGAAAAATASAAIRHAIAQRGHARIILASAPSQEPLLQHLVGDPDLPWDRVHVFHMDEYVGLPAGAPQSFATWLADQLSSVQPSRFEALRPDENPKAELERYGALLAAGPIDLSCLGIGVNGHLAFNEPDRCRFDDPSPVQLTDLDRASRQQQVEEGLFEAIEDVPTRAMTLTVPTLLRGRQAVLCAFGAAKATAVRRMLTGPVSEDCPAAAMRLHPRAQVHLDVAAASLLNPQVSLR